MDDGGYAILTDDQISNLKKKPSVSDRIKAKLDKSPEVKSSSFSYNKKKFQLDNSSKKK